MQPGCFLENMAECVSSSASAQLELAPEAALGQPFVDTTTAAHLVLFVGSVPCVYSAATV